jgi:tRNA (cytidine/uridine-2'-O-)-methyltransferase
MIAPLPPAQSPMHQLRLAAFQPDIPQNVGAMLRLCACLGLGFELIEPCGFALDDARLRRVAMDYGAHTTLKRHQAWADFILQQAPRRLILLTTDPTATPYTRFAYQPDDILLVGQESAGAPPMVHAAATARVTIPLVGAARSLNVVIAAAMVAGEALRQLGDS